MTLNTRPGTGEISNANAPERNIETNQSGLYVFSIRSHIDQKSGMSLSVKSNTLYRISFTIINYPRHLTDAPSISNYSLLSFSRAVQESTNAGNIEHYETYFTTDFLNKKAIELSEKSKLFNSPLPMSFLVGQNQEWRVKEIFESMLNESVKADAYRNEMMRTLIYEFILFSQRLTPVDVNSV